MNAITEKGNVVIENIIYEIRGVQVMLDSDAVKRNINRFPSDFYFKLTDEEKRELWFQSGTANNMSRTNPFVFTE